MRNGFHTLTSITQIPFFFNDIFINASTRHVIRVPKINVHKTLVITHVLISFQTGIQHKNFTVLGRIHSARIDI